ncbi:recombination mediator RecR [Peptoniphilus raoultii]|uniref:recombination mediator RecR n=1 Tax=Peptoniphilus raoultii TaxID=1776387 RepID=UPI0008DABA50|nr:recombination mediator RecR [Peptoniphilus raoultii]
MTYKIGPIEELIRNLNRLPGIGAKSAQRLAYYIIGMDELEVKSLAKSIGEIKNKVKKCSICSNIADKDPCDLCTDLSRDNKTICIVEYPKDVDAMERSGIYRGKYHVINGIISPIKGKSERDLTIDSLLERLKEDKEIEEIIIATSPTTDGDVTASYLVSILRDFKIKVTRIGFGLPVGGDLEYYDEITIGAALKNRREII